jgi:hypothetical protein
VLAGEMERERVWSGKIDGGVMSIAGYFSRPEHERVKDEQQLCKLLQGELLSSELPRGELRPEEEIRVCERVEDYDPVLRSHCRL